MGDRVARPSCQHPPEKHKFTFRIRKFGTVENKNQGYLSAQHYCVDCAYERVKKIRMLTRSGGYNGALAWDRLPADYFQKKVTVK